MCYKEHLRTRLHVLQRRQNLLLPVRFDALAYELEAFTSGHNSMIFHRHLGVHRIEPRMTLIVVVNLRRRAIVRLAPQCDLIVAVLFSCRLLVKTLQGTIVTLIDAPTLVNVRVLAIHFLENQVKSFSGATQQRCICDVKVIALLE